MSIVTQILLFSGIALAFGAGFIALALTRPLRSTSWAVLNGFGCALAFAGAVLFIGMMMLMLFPPL